MPSKGKLAARGGVTKVRTIRLPNGKYVHVYVVRKSGPRGGHSMAGEVKKRRTPDRRPNYKLRADRRGEGES